MNFASFSRDGRLLVTQRTEGCELWDMASLSRVRRLARAVHEYPGSVAFNAEGSLLAVELAPAVIHLVATATGQTLAKLEDPHGDRARWIGFTSDGSRLVSVTGYSRVIHVWDLAAIRRQLETLGLEGPFLPAAAATRRRVEVEVVPGEVAPQDLRAESLEALARSWHVARDDLDSPVECNNRAWILLVGLPPFRDFERGLALARRAVALAPTDMTARNTLGVACYRAGQFREAAEHLETAARRREDDYLAWDHYFLAMTYHKLGETAKSAACRARADRLAQSAAERLRFAERDELRTIQAEVDDLLGKSAGGPQ
jgi:hypothetical protein